VASTSICVTNTSLCRRLQLSVTPADPEHGDMTAGRMCQAELAGMFRAAK
jgi:hypothetical protein